MAGVYRGHGELSELQPAPLWNRLAPLSPERSPCARVLDLHAGVLRQEVPGELQALQFSSLAEPGLAVLRALAPRATLEGSPPLVAPPHVHAERQEDGAVMRIAVADGVLEAAAVQSIAGSGKDAALERIAAYVATAAEDSSRPALRRVHRASEAGRERLLSDHRRAWAERWDAADVRIDGDPELQLAVRLALFHLIACAGDRGEAAVGARGLSGRGYRGHVFWDSDVFVLPFLAATHPRGREGDPRVPRPASARSPGGRARRRPRRRPLCLGVGRERRGRHAARCARPRRAAGGDLHRPARGAHRRRRRLGGRLLHRLDRRSGVSRGVRAAAARRDGPLLGLAGRNATATGARTFAA